MIPAEIIRRKRDGIELTDGQIRDFVQQFANSQIPDYQMTAFAM
ncbi:pyrimidine-nucleoside phosphorylase, partial [Planctomycetota bacterium]